MTYSHKRIVYVILSEFKKGEDGEKENPFGVLHNEIGIPVELWKSIILDLKQSGYLVNVVELEDGNSKYHLIQIGDARITIKVKNI